MAVAALVAAFLYALFVAVLIVAGRREMARAAAEFVPDCVVLFSGCSPIPAFP